MNNEKYIICKICGLKINPHGSHIKIHHNITNKEYYDKYLKKDGEDICTICGKETHFKNIYIGYRKFCSPKCANLSEEVKIKKKTLI